MKTVALVCLIGMCLLVGCGSEAPKKGGGVQINAPGVNINVDEKGGAKVNAPGVDLNVDGKGGAKVKVPGVDINVP